MKNALITGITGQDGSYLAEFLLDHGYEVWGFVRDVELSLRSERLRQIAGRLRFVRGDMADAASIESAVKTVRPAELYNLASQSFAPASWERPIEAIDLNATAVCRMLEAVRRHSPDTKFYQASSSEMFGKVSVSPQTEQTPFCPYNLHGISKLHAHWTTVCYRESFNLFAVSGISYNHESPRRGEEFVSRKVTTGAARIKLGLAKELRMGNLDARRDWGYAGDTVRAMWLMLQQRLPKDYVIATGRPHTIRELLTAAFSHVGLDWRDWVRVDETFKRPADPVDLVGDSSSAQKELGWHPEVTFEEMIGRMVDEDVKRLLKLKKN